MDDYLLGLYAWFNLDQANYSPLQAESGFAVFVEQPGTAINNQVPFVLIRPGKISYVKLQTVVYERERTAPWKRCFGEAPHYTNAACVDECVNELIRDTCGCKFPHDPLEPDMDFCTLEDWPKAPCSSLVGAKHSSTYALCECSLPPCSEEQYTASVLEIDNSESFLASFEDQHNWTTAEFLRNFASVRINFDLIQYDKLKESKAVTPAQLLGSIGGSMGLFLGISVLSVFEVMGDLFMMRLIPRRFGARKLYGIGSRTISKSS